MENRRLKALLFDLDGTVADTDPIHIKVFQELFEPHGYNVTEEYFRLHISGKHNPGIFKYHLPDGTSEDDLAKAAAEKVAAGDIHPMPGLISLLQSAKDHGIIVGAVTNAPKENAEFLINTLHLTQYFSFIVLGDECERPKPHPEPYLEGLKRAGVTASESIVFEDSPTGVRAGVTAGMKTVGILSSQPESVLKAEGASITVKNFESLTVESLNELLLN